MRACFVNNGSYYIQNIEFALGQASWSSETTCATSQHSAIEEELRTLVLKRKASNYEVFAWIKVSGLDKL